MSVSLPLLTPFQVFAAANAALLGAAALAYPGRPRGPQGQGPSLVHYAGLMVLTTAATMGVIAVSHLEAPPVPLLLEAAERVLTLLAGGLLFALVHLAATRRQASPLAFAPAGIAAVLAIGLPGTLAAVPMLAIVALQAGFTAGGWTVLAAAGRPGPAAESRRRHLYAVLVLVAASALHVVSFARGLWPEVEALRPAVPTAAAVLFLVLTLIALHRGRTVMTAGASAAPVSAASAEVTVLDALMARDKPYLDPALRLGDLAARTGQTPQRLSELLNRDLGLTVPEYLAHHRVAEAQRLLLDPAEARTSMEAIGLMAGFGSRAAFYKLFRRATGQSPAAWRAARQTDLSAPKSLSPKTSGDRVAD